MNINTNTNTALASLAGQGSGDSAAMLALKKVMEAQKQNAATLVAASQPENSSNNLPQNLGQNVNTTA